MATDEDIRRARADLDRDAAPLLRPDDVFLQAEYRVVEQVACLVVAQIEPSGSIAIDDAGSVGVDQEHTVGQCVEDGFEQRGRAVGQGVRERHQ
ncbi:hypothetical protein SDC9_185390 [bioreactor metagenome]|uniref:Uncharacterized protein n=1 Tax=bioreactor metagenome TaxID=1076179 RepID=A0A645HI49_9ZZZZ